MLTVEQIKEKLWQQPLLFDRLCEESNWQQARYVYDTSRNIAVFLELNREEMISMFGNRPYKGDDDELIEGMFTEWKIQRAYRESFKTDKPVAWRDKPFRRIKKGS